MCFPTVTDTQLHLLPFSLRCCIHVVAHACYSTDTVQKYGEWLYDLFCGKKFLPINTDHKVEVEVNVCTLTIVLHANSSE